MLKIIQSSTLRGVFSICVGLLFCQSVRAQTKPWVDASVFAMNESQLRVLYPDLKKIANPKIGVGGVRGVWSLPAVKLSGYRFDPIIYARDEKLQRIEHVWSVIANPCLGRAVYDDVVAYLTSQLGKADGSDDAIRSRIGQKSTVWSVGDTYLITYVNELSYQCSVRLVNKPK